MITRPIGVQNLSLSVSYLPASPSSDSPFQLPHVTLYPLREPVLLNPIIYPITKTSVTNEKRNIEHKSSSCPRSIPRQTQRTTISLVIFPQTASCSSFAPSMAPLDASRGKTQSYTSLFNFGTDQQSHCQPGRTGRVPSFVSSSDLNRQNYQTQPEPNQFQTMPFYFPSREPEPHDIAVHDHDPKNFLQRQYHSPEANVWSNASADLKSTGYDCYQCAVLNSQRYANEAPMASSQPWMYGQASGFKFESLVDRLQHGAMQPYPLMVSGPLLQAHTPPTSQNDFTGSEATVDSPYTNSLHASLDEGSYLLTDNTHQPVSYLRGVSPSTAPSSVPSPGEAHAVMSKKAEPLKIPASKRVNSAHNLLSHAGSHTALEESRKRTTQQAAAAAAAKDEPYAKLIEKALLSRPNYTMSLQDIYQWFCDNTNKIKNEGTGWRNSIRHNLSMNAVSSTKFHFFVSTPCLSPQEPG